MKQGDDPAAEASEMVSGRPYYLRKSTLEYVHLHLSESGRHPSNIFTLDVVIIHVFLINFTVEHDRS